MNDKIRINKIVEKQNNYVVLSDESIDRNYGIIIQKGWILDNFLRNPIMLYSHNWEKPPLGIWENTRIENNKLIAIPKFAEIDNYDELKIIKALWDANILKTVSVTFLPIEVDYIKDEYNNNITVYKKQELLEVSIVAVPANANAMKIVYNSMAANDIKEQANDLNLQGVSKFSDIIKII